MNDEYKIIDISQFESELPEQLGTKTKFWYTDNGNPFLFKSINSRNGKRIGEDWAEKIACELAEHLGLPHAHYELATHKGDRGVITPNFISSPNEHFTAGNELLQEHLNAESHVNLNYQDISDVYDIMSNMIRGKPIGIRSFKYVKTASDFFVGYLMFDVLISNQDRHNQNWGRVATTKSTYHLALSYDHGASLARNLSDDERSSRLSTKDKGYKISNFVQKSRSQFYRNSSRLPKSRLKLMEAFEEYANLEIEAAKFWLQKLETLLNDDIKSIVNKVPQSLMTTVSKDFTIELIICNKENLLELYSNFES